MNGALPQLLFIGAIIAAFWFLILRPQQQQRKQHETMVSSLQPGARVMTIGGFFGTVKAMDGDNIAVEIADGVIIEMVSGAVAKVVADDEATGAITTDYTDHSEHDDPPVGEDSELDEDEPDTKARA